MSENLHPRADELDDLSAFEFVALMHAEDVGAVNAIAAVLDEGARAVEAVPEPGRLGGAVHPFGAGKRRFIAGLDAARDPAPFGVARDGVRAHSVEDGP